MSDCLFTFGDIASNWHCVVSDAWIAVNSDFDRIWRKWQWPNSMFCPDICLEGLQKTTKCLSPERRWPGRASCHAPPKFKSVALQFQWTRWIAQWTA